MKLTTKQLRQMIIEELNEMYKGKKDRTFYAPGPIKTDDEWLEKSVEPQHRDKLRYKIPQETGAYALPSGDPYDQLDPMVRDMLPYSDDPEDITQAYELSDTLGTTPEDSLEDLIYGAELSRNPDKVVQGHADILAAEIEKLKAVTKTSRFDEMSAKEKMEFMKRIRQMQLRLLRMRSPNTKDKAKSLDDVYSWVDYSGEP